MTKQKYRDFTLVLGAPSGNRYGMLCSIADEITALDTVIDKVKKSSKAAYESARSVDVPLPSCSDVNAIIKRGWGGISKNLDWIWKWLFGG